jgi:hypothetical protein
MIKHRWFKIAVVVSLLGVTIFMPRTTPALIFSLVSPETRVLGFYVEYSPLTESQFEARLDAAKQQGYNTIIIPMTAWNAQFGEAMPTYLLAMGAGVDGGYSPAELSAMLALVRSKGLEPILAINTIGKVNHLFGKLVKERPNLVYNGTYNEVWNPRYVCPNGDSFEEGLLAPLIDELIGLYGAVPPQYLLIAGDEIDKGALRTAADAENMTMGQFMAREFNRTAELVISHGVTPIIYQDMLMSKELASAGVVSEFPGDPRLAHYEPMNGSRAAFGGGNVMDAVDLITNRNEIIIADWHYFGGAGSDEMAYPSVDYFQTLGFKDIWGVTWYDMDTTRDFSNYAESLSCGGMLASVWFMERKDKYSDVMNLISHNSIRYFKNSNLPNVQSPAVFVQNEAGAHIVTAHSGDWVTLLATNDLSEQIVSANFSIRADNRTSWDQTVSATQTNGMFVATVQVSGSVGDVCDVKVDIETQDGLWHFGYREGAFIVE